MKKHLDAVKSIFVEAELLLRKERFDEALAILNIQRRNCKDRLDIPEAAKLFYLTASALYNLGRYSEALIKVKSAARLCKNQNDHSFYADIKLLLGRVLIRIGRHQDALEEFTESYAFYRRVRDYESAIHPLNALAQVHFISGRLTSAHENLEHSNRYAEMSGDRRSLNVNMRNLARVCIYMGNFIEAGSILSKIVFSVETNSDDGSISLLQAEIALLQLDEQKTIECIRQAEQQFKSINELRFLAICRERYGQIEYLRGNYAQAREYYQKVLDMPEPTASAVAQTLRMLTDVCVAEGNFEEAMATAKKAEKAITKINERIELGALYRAYGQIYTHRKSYDTARDYFGKSITLLREIGARYELALTYFACGESESYDYKARLRHLESARLLFDEMGVPKRVDQVQNAIDDLKIQSTPDVVVSREDSDRTIIAVSPVMKRLVALAENVAKSNLSVLLTGETGVGKDVFARYIHDMSGREGEFVTVNSAAIPEEMIESELFGFHKGAFTGAIESKAGLFEMADGGTFYLNEVADATPAFQAKLLEILETHEVRRLGDTKKRHVDFRLIAATNRNLDQDVKDGRFRLDLYHRLNELSLNIPPLRRRKDDIPELVKYFISLHSAGKPGSDNGHDFCGLTSLLVSRPWPGNVRELRAEINKLWVECGGDLRKMVEATGRNHPEYLRKKVKEMLKITSWNRRETARRLGVSDTTIRNWIKKYNLY